MSQPDYLFERRPDPGQRVPVVPGIDWICMPLPFALDHVNCWWLHDDHEACLIDTGAATADTRSHWSSLLGNGAVPDRVLATHFHPDHFGLAGWFADRGATVLAHPVEVALAERLWRTEDATHGALNGQWYEQHGVAKAAVDAVVAAGNTYRRIVHEPPVDWQAIGQGDTLSLAGRRWQVMVGGGHSPSMLMLFCAERKLLIAADQVLPGISPNVSLMPQGRDDNPLATFMASLDALANLPDDTLVLPSHGRPFRGLQARLAALREHHDQRLDAVLGACARPHSAAELFGVLFRRELDAQQLGFALGESLAHLRLLEREGRITRVDTAGIHRFATRAQTRA